MGLQLLGTTTGVQKAIEADETGINVQSFTCRYFPQFRDEMMNYQGQVRTIGMPDKFDREVRISGQMAGSGGLQGANCATAYSFSNDVSTWTLTSGGSNAGGLYLTEATDSQTFNGWREFDMTFKSTPLVT